MTIEEYFGSWSHIINLKEADKNIRNLLSMKNICPLQKDIFKAFQLCPYDRLRVVIVGQDPYPTIKKDKSPTATGIAFANSPDTLPENYSPSLEILRESVIDFSIPHGIITFDPSLEKWEKQGVLLLNAALSCLTGKPESHALLWRPFMQTLLNNLSLYNTGIVYVLMGSYAQTFESCINKRFNEIIKIRHPSWFARNQTKMPHDLWRYINSIIYNQEGTKINWYEEY